MVTFSLYSGLDLDGALMKPTMNFLQKLSADPANPSLKIKTLTNAVDKRVRTGRINDQFRAVLFEIRDKDTHHFVLVDVDSHDEGNRKAERLNPARLRLDVNPINGITTLIKEEPAAGAAVAESQAKSEAAAQAARELAAQQARAIAEEKGVEAELVEKQSPAPREVLGELTPEKLWGELGIDPALTEQVLALESEDGLDALLQSRPKWEHEAVLALVAGYSVEETRDSLGLRKVTEAEAAESEDARLLAGLRRAAAELEFAYVNDVETESLRKVIESGSFDQWRVYIHPEQRRMAEGAYSGSARVFGGAGTGKTVVAVHRANNLARRAVRNQDPGDTPPRVLLTTFTKGLAQGLKSQLNALNPAYPEAGEPGEPGVWVDNIDAVVRKVVANGSPEEVREASKRVLGAEAARVRPYTEVPARQVWQGAIEGADAAMPRELANETFLQAEYEAVVLANSITTQAEYLKVARTGRGTPLSRKQRKQVWAVLESVMQTQAIDGQLFWPTMSAVGAELLNVHYENGGGSLFDHLVVDEAQDFNAGHWRFLRACVAQGPNDIFIAEDSHQRIYVILMGVGKEIMPLRFQLKNLSEDDAKVALQRERSLLYVAASRARDALVITTVGERSELLPPEGSRG